MFFVIILYAFGFLLDLFAPGFYEAHLSLDAAAILHGQIWRIVTFIIEPPDTNIFFVIFTLYLYYVIGTRLEYAWGQRRFNLYYFSGVALHVVAAIVTYLIFGVSLRMGTYYLNMSLFFAFAAMYPNERFYLFMILPVKVKYLAILDGVYFAYSILQAFLPAYGGGPGGSYYKANALAAVLSLLNFFIFFLSTRNMRRVSFSEMKRKRDFRRSAAQGMSRMNASGDNPSGGGYARGGSSSEWAHRGASGTPRHRCAVCGRTELDDPNLEFRYCSKCNGTYEYCQDHLFTHEHVK